VVDFLAVLLLLPVALLRLRLEIQNFLVAQVGHLQAELQRPAGAELEDPAVPAATAEMAPYLPASSMVVLVAVVAVVQRREVVMAPPDNPALVQDNLAVQVAHPTAVLAELLLLVQVHQVIPGEIPHIQAVAGVVAVVLVEMLLLFPPVQAELVPPSNKHPIVQWLVLVAGVVVHTGPTVLRVQAVYMVVEQAELATLVVLLLVLKVLLFLHITRPLHQMLQPLAQQQPPVLQQPQLHLQLQAVMVVQPSLHIPQPVVQTVSLVH
jgi:hypothetical protein